MSVAKIIEISAESPKGFEDAIRIGIEKASKTINHIKGAWVSEQKVKVDGGKIALYQVILRITFELED